MIVLNKRITLERFLFDKVTFGKMRLEWLPEHKDIYTLELPKGDGGSGFCITQGLYNCIPHNSPKHPNTWELMKVPGRTSILIHAGNYGCEVNGHLSDTEGCILPGLTINETTPMVGRSVDAMKYLHELIGKDNFSIEVKDA
jgi:hypothetical protein